MPMPLLEHTSSKHSKSSYIKIYAFYKKYINFISNYTLFIGYYTKKYLFYSFLNKLEKTTLINWYYHFILISLKYKYIFI